MIDFVNTDADEVVASLVSKYETLTGRVLQPAQIERIVFDTIGYRLSLVLEQINYTANQCLLAFATGVALDELGVLLGVTRLPSSPATCIIRFQLVDGHGDLAIPAGLRVQSVDGQALFVTTETKTVSAVAAYVDLQAACTTDGIVGNAYDPGTVNTILDPLPYVSSAQNTDVTANGADAESDEELRDRIKLAPSSFSVAGPKGAYKYFARTAHPNIIDVEVLTGREETSPFDIIPGQVDIFPLMTDGEDPDTEITDAILAICNDEKVRPLSDTVVVKAPTKLGYTIEVELTILPDAVQADIEAAVNTALAAYAEKRKRKLGIDVVRNQVTSLCMITGVYDVNVVSPSADIEADENEFTWCNDITVTTAGIHEE